MSQRKRVEHGGQAPECESGDLQSDMIHRAKQIRQRCKDGLDVVCGREEEANEILPSIPLKRARHKRFDATLPIVQHDRSSLPPTIKHTTSDPAYIIVDDDPADIIVDEDPADIIVDDDPADIIVDDDPADAIVDVDPADIIVDGLVIDDTPDAIIPDDTRNGSVTLNDVEMDDSTLLHKVGDVGNGDISGDKASLDGSVPFSVRNPTASSTLMPSIAMPDTSIAADTIEPQNEHCLSDHKTASASSDAIADSTADSIADSAADSSVDTFVFASDAIHTTEKHIDPYKTSRSVDQQQQQQDELSTTKCQSQQQQPKTLDASRDCLASTMTRMALVIDKFAKHKCHCRYCQCSEFDEYFDDTAAYAEKRRRSACDDEYSSMVSTKRWFPTSQMSETQGCDMMFCESCDSAWDMLVEHRTFLNANHKQTSSKTFRCVCSGLSHICPVQLSAVKTVRSENCAFTRILASLLDLERTVVSNAASRGIDADQATTTFRDDLNKSISDFTMGMKIFSDILLCGGALYNDAARLCNTIFSDMEISTYATVEEGREEKDKGMTDEIGDGKAVSMQHEQIQPSAASTTIRPLHTDSIDEELLHIPLQQHQQQQRAEIVTLSASVYRKFVNAKYIIPALLVLLSTDTAKDTKNIRLDRANVRERMMIKYGVDDAAKLHNIVGLFGLSDERLLATTVTYLRVEKTRSDELCESEIMCKFAEDALSESPSHVRIPSMFQCHATLSSSVIAAASTDDTTTGEYPIRSSIIRGQFVTPSGTNTLVMPTFSPAPFSVDTPGFASPVKEVLSHSDRVSDVAVDTKLSLSTDCELSLRSSRPQKQRTKPRKSQLSRSLSASPSTGSFLLPPSSRTAPVAQSPSHNRTLLSRSSTTSPAPLFSRSKTDSISTAHVATLTGPGSSVSTSVVTPDAPAVDAAITPFGAHTRSILSTRSSLPLFSASAIMPGKRVQCGFSGLVEFASRSPALWRSALGRR